jgi:hypothetical protein
MKKSTKKKRTTIVPIENPNTTTGKRQIKRGFPGGYYMKSISKYHD